MSLAVAMLTRVATEAARGELRRACRRLAATFFVLGAMLLLAAIGIACAVAALVLVLADWIGIVAALLSIAGAAFLGVLILALTLRSRQPSASLPAQLLSGQTVRQVNPMTVAAVALAAGLLMGRR